MIVVVVVVVVECYYYLIIIIVDPPQPTRLQNVAPHHSESIGIAKLLIFTQESGGAKSGVLLLGPCPTVVRVGRSPNLGIFLALALFFFVPQRYARFLGAVQTRGLSVP